jgi:hypothetical protein
MTWIAKPGTWFDAGTEANLICEVVPGESALFTGIRNGRPDDEVCGLDEFDEVEGLSVFTKPVTTPFLSWLQDRIKRDARGVAE